MSDYVIGRQPIYDRQHALFAYELLYRSPCTEVTPESDGQRATELLLFDALLEHGLHHLCDQVLAFVNMTRDNLLSELVSSLPAERVVIEILEDVRVDTDLVDAVKKLTASGYTIALDDFVFSPQWEPLLQLADIVKIDLLAQPWHEVEALVKRLEPYRVKLLAEKVEREEMYRKCLDLGCCYFQGYYFQRPQVVRGKRLSVSATARLKLIAEINRPDITLPQLADTIRYDPGLSLKLLKFINSAAFGFPRRIDSIERAIVVLGLNELKRWASLIALGDTVSGSPTNIMNLSLARGRMCEKLAEAAGLPNPPSYFLVGLLSILETSLRIPIETIVASIPLAEEVSRGLMGRGNHGKALECVRSFEDWQLDDLRFHDLDLQAIGDIYLTSVSWAQAQLIGVQ